MFCLSQELGADQSGAPGCSSRGALRPDRSISPGSSRTNGRANQTLPGSCQLGWIIRPDVFLPAAPNSITFRSCRTAKCSAGPATLITVLLASLAWEANLPPGLNPQPQSEAHHCWNMTVYESWHLFRASVCFSQQWRLRMSEEVLFLPSHVMWIKKFKLESF